MKVIHIFISTALCVLAVMSPLAAEEHRPKIGLVLGGGGALGLAHVGVLKELEELRIPIDYICGTSMGAIVAGMYASGMSPTEIENQFTTLNWWDVMKDMSPYQYVDFRRKQDSKRYFMNLEFGLKKTGIAFSPGMAYGQKLNNVLETFTINSIGITDFDQLNIPYRAVATDLNSGTSVTLKNGNLATAMRASMAVPGAFTPVLLDDMVLIDGGILNNIPVNAAQEMGADIIIAVDVGLASYEEGKKSDFRSLGDVVSRTYALMQRPGQDRMLKQADIVIAPDVAFAKASQFHRAKAIIPPGRSAVLAQKESLEKYSLTAAAFQEYLASQRRWRNNKTQITNVKISGNNKVAEATIRKRIRMEEGPIDIQEIYADLNRIHGMGNFQTVTYKLEPVEDGLELNYIATEKFWGPRYLHFGMQLETSSDDSTLWSLLLNYTETEINRLGGEVLVDLELGGHKRLLAAEWFQPLNRSSAVFLEPSFNLISEDIPIFADDQEVAENEQTELVGALDAGIYGYEFGKAQIGILAGHVWSDVYLGAVEQPSLSDTLAAVTAGLEVDQRDDRIFPTKGYMLNINGLFSSQEIGASETYSTLEAGFEIPFSLGRHTLMPAFRAGSSLGTDLPIYALFDLGGFNNFAGYAPYQIRGNYYGVGSLNYRYRIMRLPPALGKDIFGLTRADIGNAWISTDEMDSDSLEYGILVGAGADTLIGTCVISVGKAESNNPRFHFSIGNVF